MANATVTVLEADGSMQTDVVILDVGRQAAAASKSLALATEDKAVLDAMAADLAALDVATVGGVAPNSNGQTTMSGSTPVVIASDQSVIPVAGAVAHDAADSGNPLKLGAKASTSLHGLTLVADADRTQLYAGIDGVLISRPHTLLEGIVSGTASNTDGSSTEVLAAGAAGVKHYLTTIILTNMHASSTIYVEIKDGSTAKLNLPCPPGGSVFNLPVPLPGTAATAWNFDPSAATTTIYCSVIGFKSKV